MNGESTPQWPIEGDDRATNRSDAKGTDSGHDRARLEEALFDSGSLMDALFATAPIGIFICDREGRFVYHNATAADIWGGFAEVEGIEDWREYQGFFEDGSALDTDDWGLAKVLRDEAAKQPRAVEIERFDGERAVVLGSASPIFDREDELLGGMAQFTDITAIKEVEEAQKEARRAAERAQRRSEFVAEASILLNSSLDASDIFEQLVQLVVPDFADWCIVDRLGPDDTLADPVAIGHQDSEMVEWAYEFRRELPPDVRPRRIADVVRSGEALVDNEIDPSELDAGTLEAEYGPRLRSLGIRSVMTVPLKMRGKILGAITFASTREDRRFEESDLDVARELARRAAVAIDNAELHRASLDARRRVADRAEQQKAVARLARRALEIDCDQLFREALEILMELMGSDTAKLMRLDDDSSLSLEAGIGWREEWLGVDLGPVRRDTSIGHALLEDEVVVVEDFDRSELERTELVEAHDLASTMSARVPGRNRPFGAIGVHSHEPRTFTEDQTEFVQGIANVLSDAIEKERIELRRRAANRRLTAALRDRQELLSVVAHDLRSPATAIRMNLKLIRRHLGDGEGASVDPEAISQSIEAAERSVERMIELMSNLLDSENREEGLEGLDPERVDYGEIIRRTAEELEGERRETGSRLEFSVDDPVRGRTDRVRFEQIASNLISNALKYGEGAPVTIGLRGTEEAVELVVRDRGEGIDLDPERRDELFERSRRNSERHESTSYGLGLWIVKRSVEVLDGSIEVESSPGDGTEFRVRLPRWVDT